VSAGWLASLECDLLRCLPVCIEHEVMCCCDVRSVAEGGADVELHQMSAGTDEPVAISVNGAAAGLN